MKKNFLFGLLALCAMFTMLLATSCSDSKPSAAELIKQSEDKIKDSIIITKKLFIDSCTTYKLDTVYTQKCGSANTNFTVTKKKIVKAPKYMVYYRYVNGKFPANKMEVSKMEFDKLLNGDTTTVYNLEWYSYLKTDFPFSS